jgi:hypothetical protein
MHERQVKNQLIDGAPLLAYEGRIRGTDIQEPVTGRAEIYRPYETVPLIETDELNAHQEEVAQMYHLLIDSELADRTSLDVRGYILHSIQTRAWQRRGTNSMIYATRLHEMNHEEATPEFNHLHRSVVEGTATIEQSEFVRRTLGMASIEYGNLTMIGDKRTEYMPNLLAEASQLVGADISDVAPYRIKVVGFDREPDEKTGAHLGAMRIQLKRKLGTLFDGTVVKQRTFAIVDLSHQGRISDAITAAYQQERHANKEYDLYIKSRKRDMLKYASDMTLTAMRDATRTTDAPTLRTTRYENIPEVAEYIQFLIDSDMCDSSVLARNETIYGYNEAIDNEIHRRNVGRSTLQCSVFAGE